MVRYYLFIFRGMSNDVVYSFHGLTASQLKRRLDWLVSHGKLNSKGWQPAQYSIQYGDYDAR